MVKKTLLFAIVALSLLLASPFVMAAAELVSPVAGTNQSTTMIFNCTQSSDLPDALNATLGYNASGGAVGTYTGVVVNDTADDQEFYSAAFSISSLSDATTYNVTCKLDNGTATVESPGVLMAIDNTDPSVSLSLKSSSMSTGRTQELTWSSSDATTGLASVTVSVTSPNSDKCSTETWTDESGTSVQVTDTSCVGTYTVTITATDEAGNSATSTETFKASYPGESNGNLGTNFFKTSSEGGEDGTGSPKTAIVIIIAIIVIYFFTRKK